MGMRRGAAGRPLLFLDHAAVLGGAELSLLDLARHWRQRAEVVLLEDGPFCEVLAGAGVAVRVLPLPRSVRRVSREGGGRSLAAVPGLAAAVLRLMPLVRAHRLVHCNSQKAFVVGALAAAAARRPVLWHLRDMLTADHFGGANRRLLVALGNRLATAVIANSQATADAFVAAGGCRDRVTVVHNGIDAAAFRDLDGGAVRRRLGLEAGPLVGCFSRLAPWKGQHVLLETLERLPGVQALIVGDALFGETAYAEDLRRRAGAPGLAGRVHLLGFRRDVPALMAACDVVVHTSVAPEPFGRMIVEGQLAGRPVVVSDAGGARELVVDGSTGLRVAPGDAPALASALARLLEDPALAARLGRQGRAAAERDFGLERMLAAFDAVAQAALRPSRGRKRQGR